MIISRRTTVAALAAALVLTAGGTATALAATASSGAGHAAASAPLTPPRCYQDQLTAHLYGPETAFPDEGFNLTLTNVSGQPCSIYGYPGLGLEDASHGVLPSHTFWGSTVWTADPGRHLIVLSPGETASANVAFFASSPTRGPAVYLEVTPPNDYLHFALLIPYSLGEYIQHGDLYVTAMAYHTPFLTEY
jgi:hypothetical protein